MALTPEEEQIRLNLYNQGLNDKEIAQKVGIKGNGISHWRYSRNLPAINDVCDQGRPGGTPMEVALSPVQCEDMKRFLASLLKYNDIAKKAGRKLNIARFMAEYRKLETRGNNAVSGY